MVASEIEPLVKTGGLADVLSGLSNAFAKTDCEVTVFLPFYKQVKESKYEFTRLDQPISVQLGGRNFTGSVLRTVIHEKVEVICLENNDLYLRDGLYVDPETGEDYKDNDLRFGFFAKAASAYCKAYKYRPHVIHAHDWQGGLVMADTFFAQDPYFKKTPNVFTIHNLSYQGKFPPESLTTFGLPESSFTSMGVELFGDVSLLSAGISYADLVTTVSEKYAEQIKTPELGFGLENILIGRGEKLIGITNGVDYERWNPEIDPWIKENYTIHNLSGKQVCKNNVIEEFNLPEICCNAPLFGVISRMIEQKGLDLIMDIFPDLMAHGGKLIVLGKGQQNIEQDFLELARNYPESLSVRIDYNEPLAHRIEAGADFFLMPSRFEPCGLNQMYSLRYGTIPIVHTTGGLDDTVKEFSPKLGRGNGFKFSSPHPEALLKAVAKAMDTFGKPRRWDKIRENAMAADHSWDRVAKKYLRLYQQAINEKKKSVL